MKKLLIDEILENSVSDDIKEAISEWVFDGILDPEWDKCVCDHEILYRYVIRNVLNGNTLSPIGNVCINYFDEHLVNQFDQIIKNTKDAYKHKDELFGYGKYQHLTYSEIVNYFPGYIKWLIANRTPSHINRKNKVFSRLIFLYKLLNKYFVSLENVECCICMDYDIETKSIETPCKHKFHYNCLITWVNKKESCPLCRGTINAFELKLF